LRVDDDWDIVKVFLPCSDHLAADASSDFGSSCFVTLNDYFVVNDVNDLGGRASEVVVQQSQ